jgi:vancomycin resistance protein YoaR
VLAVLALYLLAYLLAGSGTGRGTTVLGVDIGGRTSEAAARTLERELRDEEQAPVPVRAGDADGSLRPARAGLSLDVEGTVAAARARSWNPLHLVGALVGGREVEPAVRVDRPALLAAVDRLAATVDREKVEGSVGFAASGEPRAVLPVEGIELHRRRSADVLAEAYLGDYLAGGAPVELPARLRPPDVSRAEVARVAEEVAAPATASEVTLTVARRGGRPDAEVVVPPRAIAAALTFEPDGQGSLAPVLDGDAMRAAVEDDLAAVERPPRDATFRVVNDRPRVVRAREGRAVRPETLAAAVLPVLAASGPARVAAVPLETSEPEISTAMAESLGVTELVATYTTYYPSDFAPRLTNIHTAADYMDGTLVLPGKVFSLNRTVGERTAERGFAAGYIINNGRLEVDYGGGVSQLATTAFNAFFFAGLEILEHNPHSFYISRYPEGRESTIAWGFKDLRVRNDSPHGVFITTGYTSSSVTVTVWGTKRFRIEATKSARYDFRPYQVVHDPRPRGTSQGDCVAQEGVSGFRVIVHRLFYQGGEQVRSEEFRTRYEPEDEVVCGSDGPEPDGPEPDDPDTGEPEPD